MWPDISYRVVVVTLNLGWGQDVSDAASLLINSMGEIRGGQLGLPFTATGPSRAPGCSAAFCLLQPACDRCLLLSQSGSWADAPWLLLLSPSQFHPQLQ